MPGETLEAESREIKEKFPEWIPSEHPDFLHWSTGAQRIGPVAPKGWGAEELVGAWEREGEAALTRIIAEEHARRDRTPEDWISGPNEEGARKAIEEAVKESTEFGLALMEALRAAGNWKHVAWQGVLNAFGTKMDEARVLELLEADWWADLARGGQAWWIASMLKAAAGWATTTKGPRDPSERLRTGILRLAAPLAALDGNHCDLDWVTWSINEPGGMAVEAAIELMKGEHASEAERLGTLGTLRTLRGRETTLYDTWPSRQGCRWHG